MVVKARQDEIGSSGSPINAQLQGVCGCVTPAPWPSSLCLTTVRCMHGTYCCAGAVYKYDVSLPVGRMYDMVGDVRARLEQLGFKSPDVQVRVSPGLSCVKRRCLRHSICRTRIHLDHVGKGRHTARCLMSFNPDSTAQGEHIHGSSRSRSIA